LAGNYKISKLESVEKIIGENNESTITKTFDGTTVFEKTVYTAPSSNESVSYPVSVAEWSFNKDGTWEMTWHHIKTVITEDDYYKTTTVTDYSDAKNGSWAFLGKTKKEYKNKERVQLSVLNETIIKKNNVDDYDKLLDTTYTSATVDNSTVKYLSGEHTIVYDIDMLKNKEMVFKRVKFEDNTSHYDDGFNTPYDYTEKTSLDETITLTQINK
jgi:dsDNA-binding SOS-regulon protein